MFILLDILSGYILYLILSKSNISSNNISRCLLYWLLNPITMTISVRGSSDIITVVLIYSSIYYLISEKYFISSLFLSFSIHIRLYPIIYIPIYLITIYHQQSNKTYKEILKNLLVFCLTVGVVFISLIVLFYSIYGYNFLYQTYLYHYIRKDNRHNFSFLFYPIYLLYSTKYSSVISVLSFLPTIILILGYSFKYNNNIFISMFLQTITFVIYNKVITAQYYVWYLSLLPLITPYLNISFKKGVSLCFLWLLSELNWLYWGYGLELHGKNTFKEVYIILYLDMDFKLYFLSYSYIHNMLHNKIIFH